MLTMRYSLILVAILLLGVAPALSQESGKNKPIANPEHKTKHDPNPPKEQFSSIQKHESSIVEQAGQQQKPDNDEHLEIERKLAEYTRQLAIYTKELSEVTGTVSSATFGLVVVTAFLAGIGIWQGCQLQKSVRLARDDFNAMHRPRIRVRHIFLSEDPITHDDHVSFTIANVGSTIAHITGGMNCIEYRPKLSGLPNIQKPIKDGIPIGAYTLSAGEQHSYTIDHKAVMAAFQFERPALTEENRMGRLYCYGFIIYTDNLGTIRETGFCRVFDGNSFIRVDNPDYEYED